MSKQWVTRLDSSALGSSEVAFNDTNIQTGTRITTLVTDVQADFANRHWIVRIPNDDSNSSAITAYITNDNYREMLDRFNALGSSGKDVISILTTGLTRYDAGSFSDNMMIHEAISTVSYSEGTAPFLLSRATYSILVRAINSVVSGYAMDEIKDSIVDTELAVVDTEDMQAYPTPDQLTNVVATCEVDNKEVVALIDEGRGDMNTTGEMSVANKDDEYAASAAETVSVSNVGTVPDVLEGVSGDLTDVGGLLTNAVPVKDLVKIVSVVPCVYVGNDPATVSESGLANPDYRRIVYQQTWPYSTESDTPAPEALIGLDMDLPLMQQENDFIPLLTSMTSSAVGTSFSPGVTHSLDTRKSTLGRYCNIQALLDAKLEVIPKAESDQNVTVYGMISPTGVLKTVSAIGSPTSRLVDHDVLMTDSGAIVHTYLPIMCGQTLGWYLQLHESYGISKMRFMGTKRMRPYDLPTVRGLLDNIGKIFGGIANNVMKNPGLVASLGSVASSVISSIAPNSTLATVASTASSALSSMFSGRMGNGSRMADVVVRRGYRGLKIDPAFSSVMCSGLPNAVRSGAAVLSSSIIAMPNVKKAVGDAQRSHTSRAPGVTVNRTYVSPKSKIPVRVRRGW